MPFRFLLHYAFIFCVALCVFLQNSHGQTKVLSEGKNTGYTNIMDASRNLEVIIIEDIRFEGNQTTKDYIIERELMFAKGDTVYYHELKSLLKQSRDNLINTSLFNFVNFDAFIHDTFPAARVEFTFVERWYLWPLPIFEVAERNLTEFIKSPSFNRTNYGFYLVKENFRGRNERITVLVRAGYRQSYGITYRIPYINAGQTIGISLEAGMNLRNEIEYLTVDNQQLFYSERGSFALRHLNARAELIYRKGIYVEHKWGLRYNHYEFAPMLKELNPHFSPGTNNKAPFFSLLYELKNDRRDFRPYPLAGYYLYFRFKKDGLGIIKNEKTDISAIESSLRKFWEMSDRWHFASGVNAKASFGTYAPYYLQQGLGFGGDVVRGYENFVIDGQHFIVLKNNFKYTLIPNRVRNIGFIRNEKFSLIHYALYMNFFSDIGYVYDGQFFHNNPYSNTYLQGFGVGLDLVTYYDQVFRAEFSSTHHGDMGVFVHLIAPI